jgi:hypothetical protein
VLAIILRFSSNGRYFYGFQASETRPARLPWHLRDPLTSALTLGHDQGTRIVLQNDANDGVWAGPSKTWEWQPQEWLNSVLGCLQDEYPNLMYNVCPVQIGNFFDILFDGQSTITMKSDCAPDPRMNFVGNNGFYHTDTGKPFKGRVLALAPWASEDPVLNDPRVSLAERRATLARFGKGRFPRQCLSRGRYLGRC